MGTDKNIKLHIVTDIKINHNYNNMGNVDGKANYCFVRGSGMFDKYMGNQDSLWKPISLTHVTYPENDIIGKVLAWGSLLPIFTVVSFVTLILFRREVHTMLFFLGILLNEAFNLAVKSYVREPRPCRPGDETLLYSKYGMPSDHCQFMGFLAVYLTLFSYLRLKPHESENFIIRKHIIAFSSISAAVLTSVSRMYLHYHTLEQVVIGLVIGCVSGILWFCIVFSFCMPFAQQLVNTKLAEFFLIRDSSSIPDILWFEYTATRTEARQRNKRTSSKSQ